jgi:uncharacterized protein with HEPN domain
MSFGPREYLWHIRDECAFIERQVARTSKDAYLEDEVLQRAIVRSLEIIGEAVKKLSPALVDSEPDVDWRAIAGMRDRLIHGYFGVDHEIVWDVASGKIPVVATAVARLLAAAQIRPSDS